MNGGLHEIYPLISKAAITVGEMKSYHTGDHFYHDAVYALRKCLSEIVYTDPASQYLCGMTILSMENRIRDKAEYCLDAYHKSLDILEEQLSNLDGQLLLRDVLYKYEYPVQLKGSGKTCALRIFRHFAGSGNWFIPLEEIGDEVVRKARSVGGKGYKDFCAERKRVLALIKESKVKSSVFDSIKLDSANVAPVFSVQGVIYLSEGLKKVQINSVDQPEDSVFYRLVPSHLWEKLDDQYSVPVSFLISEAICTLN